jgi:hypothetical protein
VGNSVSRGYEKSAHSLKDAMNLLGYKPLIEI